MTRFIFTACLLITVAGCASTDERMTDTQGAHARDRSECLLGRDVVGGAVEAPPTWCRDDEEILQWSSGDQNKSDMKVDFKHKNGDD